MERLLGASDESVYGVISGIMDSAGDSATGSGIKKKCLREKRVAKMKVEGCSEVRRPRRWRRSATKMQILHGQGYVREPEMDAGLLCDGHRVAPVPQGVDFVSHKTIIFR